MVDPIPAQELAHEIKKKYKNIFVMAGNIVTSVEGESYKKYSIDIAKVGVGPGGMCTTRIVGRQWISTTFCDF